MPLQGICGYCAMEFWRGITVVCDSQEELEAWIQAAREERRMPPHLRRHGQVLLQEIRSKAPKH
jgi:hypothetical protein